MIQKYYLLLLLVIACCLEVNGQYEDCPIAKDLVSQAMPVSSIPIMKIAPLTNAGIDDEVTNVACLMPFDFDLVTGTVDPNQVLPYGEPEGKSYWFSFSALEAGSFEMIITPDSVNGRPAGNFDFLILEGGCPTDPCTEAVFCGALGPQACLYLDDPSAANYGDPIEYIPTGLANNPLADYGIVVDPTKLPEIWEAIELKKNKNYYVLIDHKNPDPLDFAGALGFPSCDYLDLGFTMEFGGTAVLGPTQATPVLNPVIPQNTTDTIPSCAFGLNSIFQVTEITDADYVWTGPSGSTINGTGHEVTVDYADNSGQVCVTITCPIQSTICWEIEVNVQPVLVPRNPVPQPCNNLTIADYVEDEDNLPGTLALFGSFTDALGLQNELDPSAINTRGTYWIVKSANVCPSNPQEIQTTPIIPNLDSIAPISICNTPYDLTTINVVETNGFQASGDLELRFFATEEDAMNEVRFITEAPIADTYWVKAVTADGCQDLISFDLVDVTPTIAPVMEQTDCKEFNLSTINLETTDGTPIPNANITFYASEIEATDKTNPLTSTIISNNQQVWARGEINGGCFDVVPIDIKIDPLVIESIGEQSDCQAFNLSNISLQTTDGTLILNTNITFYGSELDARDNINPLPSLFISSTQQIWARGEVIGGCFDVVPIDIRINPLVIQPVATIIDCGDNYDLNNINFQALNNETLNYSYHRNITDAVNNEGILLLSTIAIPTTVWIRGENALGCFDTLAVEISSADPRIVPIPDQAECGNSFNLNDLVVNEANGIPLTRTYFGNFADALGQTNEISEIVTATDTYWIRGENSTGCSDVASVNVSLTIPNIQQPGNDRLDNGEYDLRNVQILDLDAVDFLTGLTFYEDSLSAVAGTPTLASPIVTEIKTYWIRGFVNNCPVIVPFGVEAESRATIPLTIDPLDLPCTGECIDLQTYADVDLDAAYPNLTFSFYLTKDLAEEGLPENALTNLEFCAPSNVWARGIDNNNEFGLSEIIIQDMERMTVQLVSGDREICEGDTMNTNLLFQLSGIAPFTVTYSDGNELFELEIPTTSFEHPVRPTTTTTYSLEAAKDAIGCDSGPLGGASTFTVIERVQIDTLIVLCNDLQTNYTVSFNIISGDVNSLSINGNSGNLTNRTFVSDPIPIDEQYSFTISDQNGCEPYITGGGWICVCETEAAEMSQELLRVCEEGTAEATVLSAGTLDGSDQQFYVLHDSDTEQLGAILGVTDDVPIFPYTENLELEKTYYISSVVTKIDAVGLPITDPINNPCLSVSVGTPVQFYALPEVTLTLDKENACKDETVNLQFNINGEGPYNVRYTDGSSPVTLENILNGHTVAIQATDTTTYTVEAINWSSIDNCQNVSDASATLSLAPALTTENVTLTCDEAGREYTITFDIIGGDATSYLVDGSADNIIGNQFTSAPQMHESNYRFEITDANNCETIIVEDFGKCDCTADITATISIVQDISCAGESDGIVEVQANNGEAPYTFSWDDGSSGTQLTNVSAGMISVSMTDANECEVVGTLQLDGPSAITPEIELRNPRCFGDTNGSIIVRSINGGTKPYMYALGNEAPSDAGLYGNLEADIYTVKITDRAGCTYSEIVELIEPEALEVSFRETPKELNLGDSLLLNPLINQNVAAISWQNSAPLSCEDCLNPITKPIENARYVLTVTNENGCTATDELLLTVLNDKKIFAPTSFSPNNDGVNDTFGIYGGGQVAEVKSLRIFNRWGALLYERNNLPAVYNFEGGWDGKEKSGRDAPSGIYIYAAEILFKDGTTDVIRGDVAIMR